MLSYSIGGEVPAPLCTGRIKTHKGRWVSLLCLFCLLEYLLYCNTSFSFSFCTSFDLDASLDSSSYRDCHSPSTLYSPPSGLTRSLTQLFFFFFFFFLLSSPFPSPSPFSAFPFASSSLLTHPAHTQRTQGQLGLFASNSNNNRQVGASGQKNSTKQTLVTSHLYSAPPLYIRNSRRYSVDQRPSRSYSISPHPTPSSN